MTQIAPEISPTFGSLAPRAGELGIACWFCGNDGKILASPDAGTAAGLLNRSEILRLHIQNFATTSPDSQLAELFPGFFLLRLSEMQGHFVSLLLSDDVLTQRGFCQITAQLELDPTAVQRVLSPLLQRDRPAVERLAAVMGHYHADLTQAQAEQATFAQYNHQLSQSFEEMSVLFKIAHVLNSGKDPAAAIHHACKVMALTLPFRWMAIWFADSPRVVASLAGRLTQSGVLPCELVQFVHHAGALCTQKKSGRWKEVLIPGKDEFATLVNSEILAESISRDDVTIGVLLAGGKTNNDPEISSAEIQFVRATANFVGVFQENMARLAEQRLQFVGTLRALSNTIDAKDRYTRGHSERVALLGATMASLIDLPAAEVEQYRIAGLLHDIGKIGVPESALQKCGRLSDEEFEQIKQHPQIGFNILKDIPSLEQILPGVLHHHERWDGHGYPHGIAGEKIPLIARILAFADTFDAMSSSRSYRQAMPREKVLAEIRRSSGTQFDPSLVDLFVNLDFAQFDRLLASIIPVDSPLDKSCAAA